MAMKKITFKQVKYLCTYLFLFNARNFLNLHPIIEGAESGQIWHFAAMQGASTVILHNYCVGCSGTPYCYIHFQAILY
jgi:hypothetical protein